MKQDLNYSPSDCFETFPFPSDTALAEPYAVERAGKALYESRAKYMVDTDQGLTQTYNRLKDPHCNEPPVLELRRLHEEMDRAVLDAYGWSDIVVPPYGTPVAQEDRRTLEGFEDEVIDRLFALNAERAEEERALGLASGVRNAAPEEDESVSERDRPRTPKALSRAKAPGLKKASVPPPDPRRHKAAGRGTRG
jgi:hypothetical protein